MEDLSAPEGGQIALTAHNNEDGTWNITRGPGGDVLEEGLQRDEALAIVGAPTPEAAQNEQEERLAARRREIEQKSAQITNDAVFVSDDGEKVDADAVTANPGTPSATNTENAQTGNGSGEPATEQPQPVDGKGSKAKAKD